MRSHLFFFLCALTGCARSSGGPIRPTEDGAALTPAANGWRLTLLDEWGRELPSYADGGAAWFEGVQGQRYTVRVQNQSAQRIEVVVTVDGRDVISGQLGDFANQRGYVIDPYGSLDVDGFRTSRDAVATFRFTDPGDAYSARMGSAEHVGVIGVAVFTEDAPPPVAYRARDEGWGRGGGAETEAAEAPSAKSEAFDDRAAPATPAPRRSNIGTQYGEQRSSSVVDVPFNRASSSPDAVLAVYYDDRQGLIDRGLIRAPTPPVYAPQPFPNSQFAPPPPGR